MLCVIVVLTSLIVLSHIGIDIAPLLAGAGVIGLAIGFGSQALVKDIITGLFILLEDQIAVGDIVEVGKDHRAWSRRSRSARSGCAIWPARCTRSRSAK